MLKLFVLTLMVSYSTYANFAGQDDVMFIDGEQQATNQFTGQVGHGQVNVDYDGQINADYGGPVNADYGAQIIADYGGPVNVDYGAQINADYGDQAFDSVQTFRKTRDIRLFEERFGKGVSRDYQTTSEQCTNTLDFNDRASSVNTWGGCIIAFEHANCQGRSIRLSPSAGDHQALVNMQFDKMISSVKGC